MDSIAPRTPRRPCTAPAVLAVLAAAALTAAGCAARSEPSPPAPRASADAAVRVLNNTSSQVRVDLDGRPLGEVAAGGEQLFGGIAPGTYDLTGRSLDGSLDFRRDLLPLEAAETFTWVLREGGGGIEVGGDSQSATILVENATAHDVEVRLNGQSLGVAAAGATAPFPGIVPGSYRLEAVSSEASFPREYPVLAAGETFRWRLREPGSPDLAASAGPILPAPGTGRLRVENPHPEAMTVLANGTPLGTVGGGNVRIFDELAASRVLLAAETSDGRLVRGPATRIEPGRVTAWRIGPISGAQVTTIDPEDRRAEPRAPAPEPWPGAGDVDAEPVYGPQRPAPLPPLEPGELPGDDLPRPGEQPAGGAAERTFIVENGTPEDLEILLDGRSIGAVGAGMTERFTQLPALRFTPKAVSASGAREFTHPEVDLSTRNSFTWIILP
ncbi:MAG: hypothetical protein ABR599_06905 [Gemmatimonadota bacterium]